MLWRVEAGSLISSVLTIARAELSGIAGLSRIRAGCFKNAFRLKLVLSFSGTFSLRSVFILSSGIVGSVDLPIGRLRSFLSSYDSLISFKWGSLMSCLNCF